VRLPQAFLILEQTSKLLNRKIEVNRFYIGDLDTCQYLEDSGLLREILLLNICTHYRVYQGRVYYSFHKHKGAETCNSCSAEEPKITLQANYRDVNSKETHDLCCFFENNKIKFKLVDPYQSSSEVKRIPRIFMHGIEVTSEQVLTMAVKGVISSVIIGSRCVQCLAKSDTKGGGLCSKCKMTAKSGMKNGGTALKAKGKENVPRRSSGSFVESGSAKDLLTPLYAKHSGSFIGKGSDKLSKSELDDSALVFNHVEKRSRKDLQR
jgi:hypothetical protein